MRQTATAYAPGSIGNVGPGLDILGLAIHGLGDTVTLSHRAQPGIEIIEPGHPDLPTDPLLHAAAIAAQGVFRIAGSHHGATLSMIKGLPLSGGQGGSAASAIAGAVAANHLLDAQFSTSQLLAAALEAEAAVAGRHADNLAPSLLGGLVLVSSSSPLEVIRLPVPPDLLIVMVHPDQKLRTRDARAVLPASVDRTIVVAQLAAVATMVAAAYRQDVATFGRAVEDRIAEPARAELLTGFSAAKRAALHAGAYGASISGAGPTAFAVVDNAATGRAVGAAMCAAYADAGVRATSRVAAVDMVGATVS